VFFHQSHSPEKVIIAYQNACHGVRFIMRFSDAIFIENSTIKRSLIAKYPSYINDVFVSAYTV